MVLEVDVNQTLASVFRSQGYAFVCSFCEKLHRAHQVGYTKGCEAAMQGLDCAGPIAGGDFPLYEGPLTKHTLASMCYRCGAESVKGVQPAGGGKVIGACAKCFEHIRPQSGKALVTKQRVGAR